MVYHVLSLDIGYYHLGVVYSRVNDDYTLDRILEVDLVDISVLTKNCNESGCLLYHENCIPDHMAHFFKYKKRLFDECDYIVIEQQPPGGIMSVQDIIYYEYRSKVTMVSPRSVHCHFDIQHLDYERRKVASENIASGRLLVFKEYTFQDRKHDISDAYCQLIYWLFKRNNEYQKTMENCRFNKSFSGILSRLETFKFDEILDRTRYSALDIMET